MNLEIKVPDIGDFKNVEIIEVLIPEKRVPHFKPGKELRERVDYKPLNQKLVTDKGSSGA